MAESIDGLLHEATRPAGKPPLSAEMIERLVAMTLAEPPGETTHWTCQAMARAAGVSHRSVQRIWAAHGLQPHRVKTFKLSSDPRFAAKVQDVIGLYVDKHPKLHAWLERHPRVHFHFTPTSASWLNAVEGFFAKLTKQRLKRGVFKGIVDLQATINRYLAETNDNPKPFVWTADPDDIIEKVRRGKQVLEPIH